MHQFSSLLFVAILFCCYISSGRTEVSIGSQIKPQIEIADTKSKSVEVTVLQNTHYNANLNERNNSKTTSHPTLFIEVPSSKKGNSSLIALNPNDLSVVSQNHTITSVSPPHGVNVDSNNSSSVNIKHPAATNSSSHKNQPASLNINATAFASAVASAQAENSLSKSPQVPVHHLIPPHSVQSHSKNTSIIDNATTTKKPTIPLMDFAPCDEEIDCEADHSEQRANQTSSTTKPKVIAGAESSSIVAPITILPLVKHPKSNSTYSPVELSPRPNVVVINASASNTSAVPVAPIVHVI